MALATAAPTMPSTIFISIPMLEAGVKTVDLCREHGISEQTFYNWKAKYGGLEVPEAKRLKGLESENAKLKKLLADAMLDNAALKDLLAKKW
jgi:putative transposase